MFSFLLGIYLKAEFLDHMVTFLTFWETARLFSKVTVLFYNLTNNIWSFQFLPILEKANFTILTGKCSVIDWVSPRWEVLGAVILEINPEYSLEGLILKLKLQ